MSRQNPYQSPGAESPEEPARRRHRIAWLLIPAIVGLIVGASTLTSVFGTSPGDPFGTRRAAGLGGAIGMLIGAIAARVTRRSKSSAENPPEDSAESDNRV